MVREPLFTRRFVMLWAFQFGTFFSAFQLLPVIPLRIVELGGSKGQAGSFLAVYTFASAFAAPVMGTIADHLGRRRMLVTASLLFVVFSLAYAVVSWLPLVLLIGVVHGALWSGILTAAGAIMTDFIPLTRRTEGLAWWGMAPTAAIAVAPAVGLFVYRAGWWVLCAEIAALSVLAAAWARRIPGGTAPASRASLPKPGEIWDWGVIRISASLMLVSFGYGGITSYAAILSRERGVRPESIFFTVFAIAVLVVRVFTSRLGDRFGPKVLLYPSLALMPVSFAILALASSRSGVVGAAALFGIGLGAAFPAFMAFVVAHTDERRRARTFGSVIWAFDAGIGLGSFAIGVIGERSGLATAFLVAAAIGCLSIPTFALTSRQLERGTRVADTGSHG